MNKKNTLIVFHTLKQTMNIEGHFMEGTVLGSELPHETKYSTRKKKIPPELFPI